MEGACGRGAVDGSSECAPNRFGSAKPSLDSRGDPAANLKNGPSASEMDTCAFPSLGSPEPLAVLLSVPPASGQPALKRKLTEMTTTDPEISDRPEAIHSKRQKVDAGSPQLPVEMWQQVFLYLSPGMLSRCLRVSKKFYQALTQDSVHSIHRPGGKLPPLDSEAIWTNSRKLFTNLPRPLKGFTEMRMLQLLGGRKCQFCDKPAAGYSATRLYACGPGLSGLRVIWPFGFRACGACFTRETLKDIEAMQDRSISRLWLGAPHGFRTPDNHFIPDSVRIANGRFPPHVRPAKVYSRASLESLKREYDEVQLLGDGAVEEWRKALPQRAREAMTDSARWEVWELQLDPGADLYQVLRDHEPHASLRRLEQNKGKSVGVAGAQSSQQVQVTHPLPKPVFSHPVRTPEEVEADRQKRTAEIIRRCQQLDPPLAYNVLNRMDSFWAARRLTTPMTNGAWEILKPRLLAERAQAESDEQRHHETHDSEATPVKNTVSCAADGKNEHRWSNHVANQGILLQTLNAYAIDFIKSKWEGGDTINYHTAPIFAVEVLHRVSSRYQEEKNLGTLNPAISQMSISPADMKRVLENKVLPHLKNVSSEELFLCANCAREGNEPKWFQFWSLIQHCDSKHDTALNTNITSCPAIWPEEPPFHAEPWEWMKQVNGSRDKTSVSVSRDATYYPERQYSGDRHPKRHSTKSSRSDTLHSNAQHHRQDLPAGPSPREQIEKVALEADTTWKSLEGIQGLEECVRVQVTIHHAARAFENTFQQPLHLDMLALALTTNPLLDPIKRCKGLACAWCVGHLNSTTPSNTNYFARIRDAQYYSLTQLINHWKIVHESPNNVYQADWTRNMIEVPRLQLTDMVCYPGMDDRKLSALAETFPNVFPNPLPKIGIVAVAPVSTTPKKDGLAVDIMRKLTTNKPHSKKRKRHHNAHGTLQREGSYGSSHEPKNHEYDPRQPTLNQSQEVAEDPGKYDTDARKAAPHVTPPHTTPDLPAAITKALKRVQPALLQTTAAPAIGIDGQHSSASRSAAHPDIGAILRALNVSSQHSHGNLPLTPADDTQIDVKAHAARCAHISTQLGKGNHVSSSYADGQAILGNCDRTINNPVSSDDGAAELRAALLRSTHHARQSKIHNDQDDPAEGQSASRYPDVHSRQETVSSLVHHDLSAEQYVQSGFDHGGPGIGYRHEPPARPITYRDEHGRLYNLIPIVEEANPPPRQVEQAQQHSLYNASHVRSTHGQSPDTYHRQSIYPEQQPYMNIRAEQVGLPIATAPAHHILHEPYDRRRPDYEHLYRNAPHPAPEYSYKPHAFYARE